MEHSRRTTHTRFDLKYHLVWITKYRKKLLRADVAIRLRQLVRDIGAELEVEILKGPVSQDQVHRFVSCPPPVSASSLMQRIQGKSSRKLLQPFSHWNKECWGRHLWARGFFVASTGVVTDEAILESIRSQEISKEDGDFRVDDEGSRPRSVGLGADCRTHRLQAGGGSVRTGQGGLQPDPEPQRSVPDTMIITPCR